MDTLDKAALAEALYNHPSSNMNMREAKSAVNVVHEIITDALIAGRMVKLHELVRIEVVEAKARNARNPRTGEIIAIPAKKKIRCKVSNKLKTAINL